MDTLPQILNNSYSKYIDEKESDYIKEAEALFDNKFYSYSLLAVWNAALHNLKRRIEAYGVDLWISVVSGETGRKKYNEKGETITERWNDVDDIILIKGATRLGILNPKAGKTLEMINWMRNHASPAHDSDNRVEKEDVIGLILILQKNLFQLPFPDPAYSVSKIFDPIKSKSLSNEEINLLIDQINSFKNRDIRTTYGFFTDIIAKGVEPAYSNVVKLFPNIWEKLNDDQKKILGLKYHNYRLDPDSDKSEDKNAKGRIFELLIKLEAIKYIPEGTRSELYREAAQKLKKAKDKTYGWASEISAAKTINQLGTHVPSIVFEEVYQEIIAVWCGNYWGHSDSHSLLKPFFDVLNTDRIRIILRMFRENERVKEELFQKKPKNEAILLLESFRDKLTIETDKQDLEITIKMIQELNGE